MLQGIGIRITHTGLKSTSILLSDIEDGVDFLNSFRKAGPVYIQPGATVELVYTSSVGLSFEVGALRSFINSGDLTATFISAGGTPTSGSGNVFVYRPGEPNPSGNVYATWANAHAAASAIGGQTTIEIDDSLVSPAVIPSGTWDMSTVTLSGTIPKAVQAVGTNVEAADGAVLLNLGILDWFLKLNSVSTTPVMPVAAGTNFSFVLERGSTISGTTTPPIDIPATSTVFITLNLGSTLLNRSITANGTLFVATRDRAAVSADAIFGSGVLVFSVDGPGPTGVETIQTSFSGFRADDTENERSFAQMFSAGSLPGAGSFYLHPGGTNSALVASPTPNSFLITRRGFLGQLGFTQTPAAAGLLTYEVLLDGVPIASIPTDSASSSQYGSVNPILNVPLPLGSLLDVRVTAATTTPTDLRFFMGMI